MENLEFIKCWIKDLEVETNNLPFPREDTRSDFFRLIQDVSHCYYRGYLLTHLSNLAKNELLKVKGDLKYMDDLIEVSTDLSQQTSHFNSLNRSLLIESWSVFELSITYLSNEVANPEEKTKLLHYQYNEILKKIKKSPPTPEEDAAIKKMTIRDHLTHVPITRKTDFLFSKIKGYSRNVSDDKKFLLFFGKFRNTLHTNFIYHGEKDYEFKFGDACFKFKTNEVVKWQDPFHSTPKLYFYLLGNLKEIWKAIINSVSLNT